MKQMNLHEREAEHQEVIRLCRRLDRHINTFVEMDNEDLESDNGEERELKISKTVKNLCKAVVLLEYYANSIIKPNENIGHTSNPN